MDFAKELESILENDPLGLLDIKKKATGVISADERLVASFEEINAFIQQHGHEPEKSRDVSERKLYSRLEGLRASPEKVAELIDLDSYNLLGDVELPKPVEINSIEDILEDDVLGLLGDDSSSESDPNDIFNLRNVPKTIDMPDHIAKRKPCGDFEKFEPLFIQCHAELSVGDKQLRSFTGEQQISAGHFFVLNGIMVYVAKVGEKEKKQGKVNARLRCIFENGTESNMLLRSLATELYKDDGGRRVLNARDELFNDTEKVTEKDTSTGYVYVLRSKSDVPEIKEIENLYKIGFSRHPVKQRIQNAAQDPTYLMADVSIVAEYQTFNLNPQKLENLLHTFFASSCLNLDVIDKKGSQSTPREWFVVPLKVIEMAVQLLINGEIVNYRYDAQKQDIVEK